MDAQGQDVRGQDVRGQDVRTPDRQTRRRTVLFLMSDTGAGHRSAANAVLAAMRQSGEPHWRALIVDGIKECGRFPFRQSVYLYGPATRRTPRLYGRFFHLTNGARPVAAARRLCRPFICPGLRELIALDRPDVIVSTHPLFHQAAPMALRDLGVDVPIVGVVTDLFTLHRAWLARGIGTWVAPTEAAREFLLGAGVDEQRIHLLGLPIDPAFAAAPAGSRERRRTALGLDPKLPVVLLVGGGEGVGGLAEAARALMDAALPAQLVAITGRNRVLQQELLALKDSARLPVHVEGFVTNMPQWMHAADVVVTKAGPGTITEAMACGLPLILTGAVPGQEEGNVTYVIENELGVLATTPGELLARLERMLRAGDTQLARMAANARRLSRPHAASDVARLVFSSMPAPDAPSVWERTPREPAALRRRVRPGVLRPRPSPPRRPQQLVGRPARPLVMRALAMRRRGR